MNRPASPPRLSDQKIAELRAKVLSVVSELDKWTEVSQRGQCLEKFNTRIRAVRLALDQAVDPLTEVVGKGYGPEILEFADSLEMAILEVHRVWEFFRSKLAMRFVPWLSNYLLVADELAWGCYEPMLPFISSGGREPPLVFLSSASSPFTLPRGSAYQVEDLPDESISSTQLAEMLQALPVPVVGVPWFQLRHVPEALVIAHEVGHDIEHDVGLGGELDCSIASAINDETRRPAWLSWRGEIFADAFGVLTMGPAFVSTLIDFVAGAPRFIATERPIPEEWGRYPTTTLRVMLALAVLREYGFDAEASCLAARWQDVYQNHGATEFEADVGIVASALIATPFDSLNRSSLAALNLFTDAMQARAVASARDALGREQPRADDVRTLIAAARLAYDSGDSRYLEHDVPSRILRKVQTSQELGVRGSGRTGPSEGARDARDQEAGTSLAAAIAAAHKLSPDFQPADGGTHV